MAFESYANGWPDLKKLDELQTTVGDNTAGLVKDIADLQTANEYQTTETKVGKWGNEDLYCKVVSDTMPNASQKNVGTGLTNVTYRMIYGFMASATNMLPLPRTVEGETLTIDRFSVYTPGNNIVITSTGNSSNFTATFIIYYTKNPPTRDDDTNNEPNEKEVK